MLKVFWRAVTSAGAMGTTYWCCVHLSSARGQSSEECQVLSKAELALELERAAQSVAQSGEKVFCGRTFLFLSLVNSVFYWIFHPEPDTAFRSPILGCADYWKSASPRASGVCEKSWKVTTLSRVWKESVLTGVAIARRRGKFRSCVDSAFEEAKLALINPWTWFWQSFWYILARCCKVNCEIWEKCRFVVTHCEVNGKFFGSLT